MKWVRGEMSPVLKHECEGKEEVMRNGRLHAYSLLSVHLRPNSPYHAAHSHNISLCLKLGTQTSSTIISLIAIKRM